MSIEITNTYEPLASQDHVEQQPFVHPVVVVAKRTVDVVGAGSLLIATLPLFPLIALAIRIESPGPVLFQQLRVGRTTDTFSELFQMNKFRSMRTDAESRSGAVWASKNDNRITRVGKFLRKTRLDELPQLINVLRGEMSLVGPRPERPSFCRKLEQEIPFYIERTWGLRPGITGWAQVNQGYDETLDDVRSKILYDFSYALAMRSPFSWLAMEAKVVCRTVMVMAFGRGQ
ncbi:sugar transferase [Nisaea sp.]|uniref:sugar transferase n=1 Tax=Nisaea sp. TaxID=2024842 RepID=UPI002B26E36A|nr:sugar transferase [Nisaea sp.]